MKEDFDAIRSQAIQYALDMNQKSKAYDNRSNFNNNKYVNNIFNSGTKINNKNSGDISLILALILLLTQDGADMPLMLALIYIMT